MRRWVTGVSAAILATAAALLSLPSRPSDVEQLQAQRMVLAQSKRSLLSLLSPPGAGYDSTSIALTTGSGSPVTVTRASTQTCEVTPGTLTSVAADKPCVESGALKVEPAGTNLLNHSDDVSQSPWVDFATPTVTTNTWDYGRGLVGDTIEDNDATQREGRVQSFTTSTAGAYVVSCYLQAGTATSATLRIAVSGGTGSGECNFTGLSATATGADARKSCPFTAGAGLTGVQVGTVVGVVPADVGTVKVGGCQLETGSVATSYIPTGAATASRAAQTTTVATPAGLSTTEGAAKWCVTPKGWSTTEPTGGGRILQGNSSTTALFGYLQGAQVRAGNVVAGEIAQLGVTFANGVERCYRSSWSVSRGFVKVEDVAAGTSNATASFSGFGALDATLYIGGPGALQPQSAIRIPCLSASPDGCR